MAAALVGGADVPVGAMRETPAYLGLAWIDRLFGSAYLPPDRWPAAYGVAGSPVPDGWLRQLVLPFRR